MTETSARQGLRVSFPARSSFRARATAVVALLCSLALILLGGCGGNNSSTPPPPAIIGVTLATNPPGMSSVFPAGMIPLVATVTTTGNPNTNVNWAVNGVPNGNSTVGTITATGAGAALYTAPATAPNPASVNITATCAADSSKSASVAEAIQGCALNGTIGYVAPAPYVAPPGSTCDVSDVSTLNGCVAALRSGTTTNVRFTAMVNCSGNNTCLVDLSNVHGPVTFFGAPGITAGFLRTDTYTYSIMNLNGTSDITFANLTFDEGPADPACTPSSSGVPCQPTVSIRDSSSILFEQVSVLHSKQCGISFAGTQDITIQDSVIEDAALFGIWTDRASSPSSTNISITNNLIQDVQSNGIFISYAQNASISSNTLKHNHHVALFDVCNGLCPGGQIDMLNNTSLLIYSNQIIDGQIDLNNANGQTGGIEIANQNTDVTITNNIIANNLGVGIGTDPGATGTNFIISGNKVYNNGITVNLFDSTGIQEAGDCFTQ